MNFVKKLLREMGNQLKTVLTEEEKKKIKVACYENIMKGASTIIGKRVCVINLLDKITENNILVKGIRKPTVSELSSNSDLIFIIEYTECGQSLMEDLGKKGEYYCTAKTEIFVAI